MGLRSIDVYFTDDGSPIDVHNSTKRHRGTVSGSKQPSCRQYPFHEEWETYRRQPFPYDVDSSIHFDWIMASVLFSIQYLFHLDIGFLFIWNLVSIIFGYQRLIQFGRRFPKCFWNGYRRLKISPRRSPPHGGISSVILRESSMGWIPASKRNFTNVM